MARAWPILDYQADEPLRRVAPRLAAARVEEAFSHLSSVLSSPEIEAVHDMRVSMRRLQAVLRLFRDALPRKRIKECAASIDRLVKLLGRTRELDVMLDLLRRQVAVHPLGSSPFGLTLLIARLELQHDRALHRLRTELGRLDRRSFSSAFIAELRRRD